MTKKDQDNLAKLYLENVIHENVDNLAYKIMDNVFKYGDNYYNPTQVARKSNIDIIDKSQDDNQKITTLKIDIPYDIMGVDGDEAISFIENQLSSRDSSGHGGGKFSYGKVLGEVEPSQNGEGWGRFTIQYVEGYDI